MIKEYITYLKDNPNQLWFKRKLYGWGWTPATWQGWAVLAIFIFLILLNFFRIDSTSHSASDTLINFIPQTIIIALVLIAICYKKGEKPRWQWGPIKEKGGKDKDWSDYYKATKAKPPRPLLVKALEYVPNKNKAIDIGGGVLNDTKYLLDQGFDVTVIDKSPLMEEEAKNIPSNKLHTHTTSFEDFDFPQEQYDLASAMFALPFTTPEHFNTVFSKIKDSLKKDGIFCGQFFGDRDEWKTNPKMTFHTEEQARGLLNGLEVISFKEDEKDDKTATGGMKHWHIFHIIARKI